MGENFCISKHIYLFVPLFNVKSTNDEHFLHYATAYVIKQITTVYHCEFSVFHNCCYFFVLVFNSIDSQVFKSKDSL